ncbi:hypothetical protein [Thermogemmatispora sp.]|uniref:hypothetical protein n=1 Tax=Thermogemmatispora sp. TaxID=1968838 RepID=UPI001D7A2825|nr:hypothetical protein [Thermogemmatispora sp.]MBX5448791.1 hypothetical protein [Thermogemmatispora sp.]
MQEPQQASEREAKQGPSPGWVAGQMSPVQTGTAGGPAPLALPGGVRNRRGLVLRTSLLMALAFLLIMALLQVCTMTSAGNVLYQLSRAIASGLLSSSTGSDTVLSSFVYSLIFSLVQTLLASCVYLGFGIFLGRRTGNMSVVMSTAVLATLWYVLLDVLSPFISAILYYQMHDFPLNDLGNYFSSPDFIQPYIIFTIFDAFMICIWGLGAAALGGELTLPKPAPVRLDPYMLQGPLPVQIPPPIPGMKPPQGTTPNQEPPAPSGGAC